MYNYDGKLIDFYCAIKSKNYCFQEIRPSMLRLQVADNARTGSGRDRSSGRPGPKFSHSMLQVRRLRPRSVVRQRGTRLLSSGRPRPLQKLQRDQSSSSDITHDYRVVECSSDRTFKKIYTVVCSHFPRQILASTFLIIRIKI